MMQPVAMYHYVKENLIMFKLWDRIEESSRGDLPLCSDDPDEPMLKVTPCGTILITKYAPKCRIWTFKVEDVK